MRGYGTEEPIPTCKIVSQTCVDVEREYQLNVFISRRTYICMLQMYVGRKYTGH